MEVNELEQVQRGDNRGNYRVRCMFCKKWVAGEEIKDFSKLPEVPCPRCGETGEEFRKKQKEVSQALGLDNLEV